MKSHTDKRCESSNTLFHGRILRVRHRHNIHTLEKVPPFSRPLHGFTLVELLVVTGLLAALFALVLAVGRPSEKSTIRRAAQDFAGSLLATQSRALGKPEGAAVMIVPLSSTPRMGTDVYAASMQPLTTAAVSGWPPTDPRQTAVPLNPSADQLLLQNTFRIRFQTTSGDPVSPWFAFVSGTSTSSGTASFRDSAGQTMQNTIWPKGGAGIQAALAQYPSAGILSASMAKQVAIDLKHSGVGEDPSATHGYGSLEAKGTIAVVYDEVGRVSEVMRNVQEARTASDQPIATSEIIYFLFATRSDIDQSRSLSSQNSIWIAISPLSGRVTVAENMPQATVDATALKAARAKAREGTALK